jgi:sulfane dehydrogenase subunit SoxC
MSSPADAAGLAADAGITPPELQLAARNHGMPLEALRYPITPLGLHYLLIHYDIPPTGSDWRLEVAGAVRRPLRLDLDALRARPHVRTAVTMECAGNGRARLAPRPVSQPWLVEAVGTAEWGGTPLRGLLEEAGVGQGAVEVVFTGADRGIEGGVEQQYQRALPLAEALGDDVLLAWEVNGVPLPPQHGAPLRLVVPGWYGMTNVKWLDRIEVVDRPFAGYQQTRGYRLRRHADEDGEPVARMLPRALVQPPGIPDFLLRERTLDAGPCVLTGRAWSGVAPIAGVRVSMDGGRSWADAELEPGPGPAAWVGFRHRFDPPRPGRYEIVARARDEAGNEQPLEDRWNLGGYANNAVQRVPVTVRAAAS